MFNLTILWKSLITTPNNRKKIRYTEHLEKEGKGSFVGKAAD